MNGYRLTPIAPRYSNGRRRQGSLFDQKLNELDATNLTALPFQDAAFQQRSGRIAICDFKIKFRRAGPGNEQPNPGATVRQVFDTNAET